MPEMLRVSLPLTPEQPVPAKSLQNEKRPRPRGFGRVYRRGNIWWIQYRHRGRLVRESSGSDVRRVATNLLRERLRSLATGQPLRRDLERVTFEELAQMLEDDYAVNGRKSWSRAQR